MNISSVLVGNWRRCQPPGCSAPQPFPFLLCVVCVYLSTTMVHRQSPFKTGPFVPSVSFQVCSNRVEVLSRTRCQGSGHEPGHQLPHHKTGQPPAKDRAWIAFRKNSLATSACALSAQVRLDLQDAESGLGVLAWASLPQL